MRKRFLKHVSLLLTLCMLLNMPHGISLAMAADSDVDTIIAEDIIDVIDEADDNVEPSENADEVEDTETETEAEPDDQNQSDPVDYSVSNNVSVYTAGSVMAEDFSLSGDINEYDIPVSVSSTTYDKNDPSYNTRIALVDDGKSGNQLRVTARSNDVRASIPTISANGYTAVAFHLDASDSAFTSSTRWEPTLVADGQTYNMPNTALPSGVYTLRDNALNGSAPTAIDTSSSGRFSFYGDPGWVIIPFSSYGSGVAGSVSSVGATTLGTTDDVITFAFSVRGSAGHDGKYFYLDDIQFLNAADYSDILAGNKKPLGALEPEPPSPGWVDSTKPIRQNFNQELTNISGLQRISHATAVLSADTLGAGPGTYQQSNRKITGMNSASGTTKVDITDTDPSIGTYYELVSNERSGFTEPGNKSLKVNVLSEYDEMVIVDLGTTAGHQGIAFWVDFTNYHSNMRLQPTLLFPDGTTFDMRYSTTPDVFFTIDHADGTVTNRASSTNGRIGNLFGFKGWIVIPFSSYTATDSNEVLGTSTEEAKLQLFMYKIIQGAKSFLLDDIQFVPDITKMPIYLDGQTGEDIDVTPPTPPSPPSPPSEGTDLPKGPTAQTKSNITVDFKVAAETSFPQVGDYVKAKMSIDNFGSNDVSNIKVYTDTPPFLINSDSNEFTVQALQAGKKAEITFFFKALSAGRGKVNARVVLPSGTTFTFSDDFTVMGAGWLRGDQHSHSKWSDGGSAIRENANMAYDKGLSWLYSTDHSNGLANTNANKVPTEQTAAQTKKFNGALVVYPGTEVTTGSHGHSNIYFLNNDAVPPYQQNSAATWTDHFNTYKALGALSLLNHPYRDDGSQMKTYYDVAGYFGVEGWNGGHHPLSPIGARALRSWDDLNIRGQANNGINGKVYALASSDAHNAGNIAGPHTVGYFPEYPKPYSSDNGAVLKNVFNSGNYYGTNGPDLRFSIDGVPMGAVVTGATGQHTIKLHAVDDYSYLTKVTLLKGNVTGQNPPTWDIVNTWTPASANDRGAMQVVNTWDLSGQNLHAWETTYPITANDNDFYRVEVQSAGAKFGSGSGYAPAFKSGFAFSNPIWISTAGASNTADLLSATYNGTSVHKSVLGEYYVIATNSESMDVNKMTAIVVGSSKSISYDNTKDQFTVTVTAASGAQNSFIIGVVRTGKTETSFDQSEGGGNVPGAKMIQDFEMGNVNSVVSWAWGRGDVGGGFFQDDTIYNRGNLSIVDLNNNKVLKGMLSNPTGNLTATSSWWENVSQIKVGAVEDNFKEISFWVDMSNCTEVTRIKANLSDGSSKYWETTAYTLIFEDESKPNQNGMAGKGELVIPSGFRGYVSVSFASYKNPEQGYAIEQNNPNLMFEFYVSKPMTGSFFYLDHLQVRETGAPFLPGSVPPDFKAELAALVASLEDLKESDYTPESWQAFIAALNAAKAVLAAANPTQVEIGAAESALRIAYNALVAAKPRVSFTATTNRATDLFEANLHWGVTHTHYWWDVQDPDASARAADLLTSVSSINNTHIMGWGAKNPWPSKNAAFDFSDLRHRVDLFDSLGGEKWMTFCTAPGWMKGEGTYVNGGHSLDWEMHEAPLPEFEDDFAYLCAQIAKAFPEVTTFQVWNEFKGMWKEGGIVDYERYTRLYNKVYTAVKAVRPDAKIGGFYLVVEGDGSISLGVNGKHNYEPLDSNAKEALRYFLDNAIAVDYLLVDRANVDYHNDGYWEWQTNLFRPTRDQAMQLTKYFAKATKELAELTDLPIVWSEYYGTYGDNNSEFMPINSPYIGAHYASILYNMIKGAGGRDLSALLWIEWDHDLVRHSIFTNTDAGGGQPTPHYYAMKKLLDNFPMGTMLHDVQISSPDVEQNNIGDMLEILASDQCAYVINKTSQTINLTLDGTSHEISAYGVEVLDLNTTQETVATPVANPNGGQFTTSQWVTLSCATPGAEIFYTLDGSTPTRSSTLYTGAIAITNTKTLKAFAIKSGMIDSSVMTSVFRIEAAGTSSPGTIPPSKPSSTQSSSDTNEPANIPVSKNVLVPENDTSNIIKDAIKKGKADSTKPVAVINIKGDAIGAIITGKDLLTLVHADGVLLVNNGSFSVTCTSALIKEWAVAAEAKVTLTLKQQANLDINKDVVDRLVRTAGINNSLFKVAREIAVTVGDRDIGKTKNPYMITVDVSGLNLNAKQKPNFTGIHFDSETQNYQQLGGEFSADGKTFTFHTYEGGVHSVIVSGKLLKLHFAIDKSSYTKNNTVFENDIAPFISTDNKTMMPLRVVAEGLGAEVNWIAETRTVIITKNGATVSLTINETLPGDLGTAIIVNDRTFVPLRYVAEKLGANVVWDATDRTVRIYQ